MITSLDGNDNIFIHRETSENGNGVIRSEVVRWEYGCSQWAAVEVILVCGEREALLRWTTQSVLWNFRKGQFNKTHYERRLHQSNTETRNLWRNCTEFYSPLIFLHGSSAQIQWKVPAPGPGWHTAAQRSNCITVTLCPNESPLLTQFRMDEEIQRWFVMRDRSKNVFAFSPEGWPIAA